jgi:hypothetical protein
MTWEPAHALVAVAVASARGAANCAARVPPEAVESPALRHAYEVAIALPPDTPMFDRERLVADALEAAGWLPQWRLSDLEGLLVGLSDEDGKVAAAALKAWHDRQERTLLVRRLAEVHGLEPRKLLALVEVARQEAA